MEDIIKVGNSCITANHLVFIDGKWAKVKDLPVEDKINVSK